MSSSAHAQKWVALVDGEAADREQDDPVRRTRHLLDGISQKRLDPAQELALTSVPAVTPGYHKPIRSERSQAKRVRVFTGRGSSLNPFPTSLDCNHSTSSPAPTAVKKAAGLEAERLFSTCFRGFPRCFTLILFL